MSHGWIERVFSRCGTVVYVSVPRYKSSGDSKGFAFVEFEKAEEAGQAVQVRQRPIRGGLAGTDGRLLQVLNNPPEDAPRKAGIFPKTRSGKPVHLPPPAGEEEEKKKRKKKKKKEPSAAAKEAKAEPAEGRSSAPKRRRSAAEKTPGKPPEKKRRRSQTTDESESDVPAKIRRTRASEDLGEVPGSSRNLAQSRKTASPPGSAVQSEAEKDGKENGDDSAIKAKRKRKKKHKEKLKVGEEVVPLRVLSK